MVEKMTVWTAKTGTKRGGRQSGQPRKQGRGGHASGQRTVGNGLGEEDGARPVHREAAEEARVQNGRSATGSSGRGKHGLRQTYALCLARTPRPSNAAVVSDSEMSDGNRSER